MEQQTLEVLAQGLQEVFRANTSLFTAQTTNIMYAFTALALIVFGLAAYFSNKFTKERIEKIEKNFDKRFELEKKRIENKNQIALEQMRKKVSNFLNSLKEFKLKEENDIKRLEAEVERSHYFACESDSNVAAVWALRSARDYKISGGDKLAGVMFENAIESFQKADLFSIKQDIIEIDGIIEYFVSEKRYKRLVEQFKKVIDKKYISSQKK